IKDELEALYEPNVSHRHRHNMVLSVEDGLLAYFHKSVRVPYPRLGGNDLAGSFSTPSHDKYHHLKLFGAFMFMLTANKTLLLPEFSDYLTGFETAGA
ncbi:MAG: hypothetical protein ACRD3J_05175, partial [Thermoanaerobaculia bacterium]